MGDNAQVALRDENNIKTEVSGNDGGGLLATSQGRFLDGSALPSGMYLVRASVSPENGGAASAFTQRLTLLK